MSLIIPIVLSVAALIGSFSMGYSLRGDKCEADSNLIQLAASKAASEASTAATAAISKIRVNYTTVKQEVLRETIEKPVYRDCKHEPSVMRNINSALAGKPISGRSMSNSEPSE